jgi:uncharacterized membrane protein
MNPREFLRQIDDAKIVAAIKEAEQRTSGEIRVFVSHDLAEDVVAAAQERFLRLRMKKTRERNGVLIFVAPRARKFAVIGDEGVHRQCGEEFWRLLAEEMSGCFKRSEFTEGITLGVRKAGELLTAHFPRRCGDQNELSDRVGRD